MSFESRQKTDGVLDGKNDDETNEKLMCDELALGNKHETLLLYTGLKLGNA